jgi:hypothetical protein
MALRERVAFSMLAVGTLLLVIHILPTAGVLLQPPARCGSRRQIVAVLNQAAVGMLCAAAVQTVPSAGLLPVPAALTGTSCTNA